MKKATNPTPEAEDETAVRNAPPPVSFSSAQDAKTRADFDGEAEGLVERLEELFRGCLPDMPSSADLVELRTLQAQLRDLVTRAAESSAGTAEELAALQKERDKFKAAAAKARADFLNYQARSAKDLARAEESALRGLLTELLPVLDGFDLARADAESGIADPARVREALSMLAESLEQMLAAKEMKRIGAAGELFDPRIHEAVASRPADPRAGEKPNQVVEELRSGWLWKEKVLRPAQVLVALAESPTPERPASEASEAEETEEAGEAGEKTAGS